MAFPSPVILAIPLFLGLILIEIAVVRSRGDGSYCWRDTLTSISLGAGNIVAGILSSGLLIAVAIVIHRFALFDIGYAWWAFLICFLLDDLAYYVFHRSAHAVRWFWASHVVHHSSEQYNLSTALRQTWTGLFSLDILSRLPLFLIGFPPPMVFFCIGLNLVYQFWIHTETIGQMPRWFEAVMNTPAHHRLHHAVNPRYLDRNYAGVFIVWDRLFGTFETERAGEAPRYGIVTPLGSFNILRAAFHEWGGIARDLRAAPGLRNKLGYLLRAPGWSHDGSRETTAAIRARWQALGHEPGQRSGDRGAEDGAGDEVAGIMVAAGDSRPGHGRP